MLNVIVREKVKNHEKWFKGFNEDASNMKGSLGGTIFQLDEDPNQHYIIFEWEDRKNMDSFLKFLESDAMKLILEKAGVVEHEHYACEKVTKFKK